MGGYAKQEILTDTVGVQNDRPIRRRYNLELRTLVPPSADVYKVRSTLAR
jgi:hypothetical protein